MTTWQWAGLLLLAAVAGRERVELLGEVAAPFAFGVLCEALGEKDGVPTVEEPPAHVPA